MLKKWFILIASIATFFITSAFVISPAVKGQQQNLNPWVAFFLLLLIIVIIAIMMFLYALRTSKSVAEAGLDKVEHPGEAALDGNAVEEIAPSAAAEEPAAVIEPAVESPAVVPAALVPDDLTVIEGIGPKISSILQAGGVTTFSQLAAADVNQLRQLMLSASLRLADPGSWPEQANLLAQGDTENFIKFTSRLRAGRTV